MFLPVTWKFFQLKLELQWQQSRTGSQGSGRPGGGETHAARGRHPPAAPHARPARPRRPGPPGSAAHRSGGRRRGESDPRARTRETRPRRRKAAADSGSETGCPLTSERPDCTRHRKRRSAPPTSVCSALTPPAVGGGGARLPGSELAREVTVSGLRRKVVGLREFRTSRPLVSYSGFIILLRGIENSKRKRKMNSQKIQKKEKNEFASNFSVILLRSFPLWDPDKAPISHFSFSLLFSECYNE